MWVTSVVSHDGFRPSPRSPADPRRHRIMTTDVSIQLIGQGASLTFVRRRVNATWIQIPSCPHIFNSTFPTPSVFAEHIMMRLLTCFSLFATAAAWTTGSAVSSFGGSVLISSATNGASLEMKKGKANVPPQMRGQYKKQQEMAQMREQMISASKPGDDGLPVFNLFVRTKLANVWYPCGSFKGDDRSAALAKGWADGGLFAGISKKQLDAGIAGSLYRDLEKLKDTVVRAYPQLKKNKDNFEFGYKLAYEGLSEEQSNQVFAVEPKEQKGVLDGIKTIFS